MYARGAWKGNVAGRSSRIAVDDSGSLHCRGNNTKPSAGTAVAKHCYPRQRTLLALVTLLALTQRQPGASPATPWGVAWWRTNQTAAVPPVAYGFLH